MPPHVSGLIVAHHQKAAMYTCDNWYLLYVLVELRLSRPADSRLKSTAHASCHIYTLLASDDGLLASPKQKYSDSIN
jgi:hypothetical protein